MNLKSDIYYMLLFLNIKIIIYYSKNHIIYDEKLRKKIS